MTTEPWTPGPWRVKGQGIQQGTRQIVDASGRFIGEVTRDEATVIALAPAMAEALADLLARVDGPWADGENSESGNAVRVARDLLARARGETA